MAQFKPGQSGNPGGRPKEDQALKAAAREWTSAALQVLIDALSEDDVKTRITAAQAILDRGHGKPTQAIAGDADAEPIQAAVRVLFGRD